MVLFPLLENEYVRLEAIKLLEENIGRIFSDINYSKIIYDSQPRVMEIKTNKWDLIKLNRFCTTKETISKVKRQPSEWEKIIANEATACGGKPGSHGSQVIVLSHM